MNNKTGHRLIFIFIGICFFLSGHMFSQLFSAKAFASQAGSDKVLTVYISSFEPCVFIDKTAKNTPDSHIPDSGIKGFDIDLVNSLAQKAGYKCTFKPVPFEKILDSAASDQNSIGAAGITITGTREEKVDFSHQYLQSGLKIMVKKKSSSQTGSDVFFDKMIRFRALKVFISTLAAPGVIEFSLCLVLFVLIAAHVIWLAEKGEDAIDDRYFPGIFEAIYFCFVTTSTVGYGDITPKKWLGKIVTLLLILIGIAFFANFTALLSADYTADRIDLGINSPSDLKDRIVATKKGTVSHEWLIEKGAIVRAFDEIDTAYEHLEKGSVEALVFDSPSVLYYHSTKGRATTSVVEGLFYPQYYGFAFKRGSDLRKKFNLALLKAREDGTYSTIYNKWFK